MSVSSDRQVMLVALGKSDQEQTEGIAFGSDSTLTLVNGSSSWLSTMEN